MFPIGIDIEISVSYAESDVEDLLATHSILYEKDLLAIRSRKKAPLTLN